MLEFKNVTKKFGEKNIFESLSYSLQEGEILTIVGPSGQGKTTLLRILAGLETADSGEFFWDDRPFHPENEKEQILGLVFQDYQLFPHLTVEENITLAPRLNPNSKQASAPEIENLFSKLELNDLRKQYPFQLSGGQKQRVAIARALALKPDVLGYDEPTAALDPALRDTVSQLILQLQKEGITQIVVTHDPLFAQKIATKTLNL
ncbi:amino acid ABC transporter ATP-binding protein [Enterococcus timonensis]|uniref:amino acid ABC transporter ATP-binding protein n=1 Tax=Enterococcus timonensis TaxID=1852364 RepID=UPI0008DA2748|nr:ATP-binding cassette domain-containing protein [Enterococcus timonensis]